MKRFWLALAFLIPAQAPVSLPEKDPIAIENLFELIGMCKTDVDREYRYERKLIDQISNLENDKAALQKENADLRAQLGLTR